MNSVRLKAAGRVSRTCCMEKRMEAQSKMIDAMGLNEQTVRRIM
jgi:hypothetical protein